MSTKSKIFSSSDLPYALKQAAANGYHELVQSAAMRSIIRETPVTVVAFKEAATPKTNWEGKTILGQLQMEQTRTVQIDSRTKEDRALGIGGEKVYPQRSKKLVHFEQVTSPAMAALQPGHAFSRDFYLCEVVTFNPTWEGDKGIVTSQDQVVRYSTKFWLSTATGEREPDRLLLDAEQYAAMTSTPPAGMTKRQAMLAVVARQQRADGRLTDELIAAAIARDTNNVPQQNDDQANAEAEAQAQRDAENGAAGTPNDPANIVVENGVSADADTGEVLAPTGFGK